MPPIKRARDECDTNVVVSPCPPSPVKRLRLTLPLRTPLAQVRKARLNPPAMMPKDRFAFRVAVPPKNNNVNRQLDFKIMPKPIAKGSKRLRIEDDEFCSPALKKFCFQERAEPFYSRRQSLESCSSTRDLKEAFRQALASPRLHKGSIDKTTKEIPAVTKEHKAPSHEISRAVSPSSPKESAVLSSLPPKAKTEIISLSKPTVDKVAVSPLPPKAKPESWSPPSPKAKADTTPPVSPKSIPKPKKVPKTPRKRSAPASPKKKRSNSAPGLQTSVANAREERKRKCLRRAVTWALVAQPITVSKLASDPSNKCLKSLKKIPVLCKLTELSERRQSLNASL